MDHTEKFLARYSDNVTRADKFISNEDRRIISIVNYMCLITTISFFGVVTNIMNIIIFYKQGFSNTMNISFFALAISDLLSLITLVWFALCLNPLFENPGIPIMPPEFQHLIGGKPHICFVRITGWITVFITAERCLCITMPLKIKQIITPRRTTATVCIIYISIMASFYPEYATAYIGWKFYPQKNETLLGLVFTTNRKSMEGMVFYLYSVLGTSAFIAVIVFTVVLIVSLKKKTKWRRTANVDQEGSILSRERKTVTMVVLLATVVIVCYIPGVAISLVVAIEPEFSILGKYVNSYFVSWSFSFIFDAINASVNIILYYKMSTKYRVTFHEIFGCRGKLDTVTKREISTSGSSLSD